jgi:hypothetical protein
MSEPVVTSGRVAVLVLTGALVLVGAALIVSAQVAIIGMAGFAFAGAAARMFAPLRRAFVVRNRVIDVAVLAAFGAALLYLGLTTPLG